MTENKPPATAEPALARQPRRRGPLAKLRLIFLCALLLLLVAVQAPVFPHVVRALLHLQAWRNGVSLTVRSVEGNLFEPVVLREVLWSYRAAAGATTRVEVRRVRAWLAWSNVFPEPASRWIRSGAEAAGFRTIGADGGWMHEVEFDDVTARLSLPDGTEAAPDEDAAARWFARSMRAGGVRPGKITMRNADLILDRGPDYARSEGTHMTLSEVEPGAFRARQFTVRAGHPARIFRDVRGLTSMEGSRATIAGVKLAPDVTLTSLSVTTPDFSSGRVVLSAAFAAFGGKVDAEAKATAGRGEIRFECGGSFSDVSVAGLASFLNMSDAAGGVLKEGHFTYRGTPRDFARAEATLRFEAGAFQWDSRQWDSLVLGLSLVDQRLQIPEFRLRQGRNQLMLKGTTELPRAGARWWERQFDFKVEADILNLTELSALMLPEFKFAAGELSVRGSVSGSGAQPGSPPKYDGQMIIGGKSLQWRTAPIDNLNAALLFRGREIQITSAQLLRKDDFLLGSGSVSLADGSYSGDVRLSARDLAIYRPVLSPHLVPAPLGGGISGTWTGKGRGAAHEGKFSARLERFRLLEPGGTLPLDAEFSGTYKPGEAQIEKLRLAEDSTALTAAATIGPGSVHLRDVRVETKGKLRLKGDALLPLNLWQQWPDVTFARLLNEKTAGHAQFEATELDLRSVSRLTGVDWPLAGTANGNVSAEGSLSALRLAGSARVAGGTFPLDWRGAAVSGVDAAFSLDGATVRLEKAAGKHAGGDFALAGTMDLAKPATPAVAVEGGGNHEGQPFTFTADGPATKLRIITQGNAPFAGNATPVPAPVPAPQPPAASAPPPAAN